MTRKQALHKALETLTDKEAIDRINEILKEMPFTRWNELTVFDAIDQFVIDNGINPTASDFTAKGMPPHPVIKLRFGVTLGEFLEKYYPQPKIDKEERKRLFISEYIRIHPKSAGEFNQKRADGVPTWITFAKVFGITKWLEWLSFCGLEKNYPAYKKIRRGVELTILSHTDLNDS